MQRKQLTLVQTHDQKSLGAAQIHSLSEHRMQFGSFESHQDLPVVTTKTLGTSILVLLQILCVLPPRQQSHLAAALKIDKLPGFSVLLDASNF